MGLDITAYSNIKLIKPINLDIDSADSDDDDWDKYIFLYNHPDFPEQGAGITTGLYDCADSRHIYDSGYRSYNIFRDWLSRSIAGVEAKVIWESPDAFGDISLLVNFADNEGVINAECCAKLLAVLESNRSRLTERESVVDELIDGLSLAAQNGCLKFH